MEAPSSQITPARAPSRPRQTDSGKSDPTSLVRDQKVEEKEKFRDVFEVSGGWAEVDRGLFDEFSDQISVAKLGRQNLKSTF